MTEIHLRQQLLLRMVEETYCRYITQMVSFENIFLPVIAFCQCGLSVSTFFQLLCNSEHVCIAVLAFIFTFARAITFYVWFVRDCINSLSGSDEMMCAFTSFWMLHFALR
jgi:hypothetical protein